MTTREDPAAPELKILPDSAQILTAPRPASSASSASSAERPLIQSVVATIGKLPATYLRRLGVRTIPRVHDAKSIRAVILTTGTRVIVDGLVKAIDLGPDGKEAFFAAIRPAKQKPKGWKRGYVRRDFLVMDPAAPELKLLADSTDTPTIPPTARLRAAVQPLMVDDIVQMWRKDDRQGKTGLRQFPSNLRSGPGLFFDPPRHVAHGECARVESIEISDIESFAKITILGRSTLSASDNPPPVTGWVKSRHLRPALEHRRSRSAGTMSSSLLATKQRRKGRRVFKSSKDKMRRHSDPGLIPGDLCLVTKWIGTQLLQQPDSKKLHFAPKRTVKHGQRVNIKAIRHDRNHAYALVAPVDAEHNVGWMRLKHLEPVDVQPSPEAATPAAGLTPSHGIPEAFEDLIHFIKKHYSTLPGIFRHPGDAIRVNALVAYVRAGKDMESCTLAGLSGHDVASAFKQILREVKDVEEPLINFACYQPLLDYVTTKGTDDHVLTEQIRKTLQCLMPPSHRKACDQLLSFLQTQAELHEKVTHMGCSQFAVCFTPSIMQRPPTDDPAALLAEVAEIKNAVKVVEHMIRNARMIFRPATMEPEETVRQVRSTSAPISLDAISGSPTAAQRRSAFAAGISRSDLTATMISRIRSCSLASASRLDSSPSPASPPTMMSRLVRSCSLAPASRLDSSSGSPPANTRQNLRRNCSSPSKSSHPRTPSYVVVARRRLLSNHAREIFYMISP